LRCRCRYLAAPLPATWVLYHKEKQHATVVTARCASHTSFTLWCCSRSNDPSSTWKSLAVAALPVIMLAAVLFPLLSLLSAPAAASSAFAQKCLAFEPEKFVPGATRNVLEYVAANTTLTLSDNIAACNRGSQAVVKNICRVALSIQTSNQSNIAFEAWLPETWSGRFLATGNGGIDGCACSDATVPGNCAC